MSLRKTWPLAFCLTLLCLCGVAQSKNPIPPTTPKMVIEPGSWLPKKITTLAKARKISKQEAEQIHKSLSRLTCIPVSKLRLADGCFSRAHAMWAILNQKGLQVQKIWAITKKETKDVITGSKHPTLWVWRPETVAYASSHTAALYKTQSGLIVIDPKKSKKAMTLEAWRKSINFHKVVHNEVQDLKNHTITVSLKKKDSKTRRISWHVPSKAVHWPVHVALLVDTKTGKLVLDPSLSPRPLSIEEWKQMLHFQEALHKIQFTAGNIYNPLATKKHDNEFEATKRDIAAEWRLSGLNTSTFYKKCP